MILGISTSLSQFSVSLHNKLDLIYCNRAERALHGQSDIHELVTTTLEKTTTSIRDITSIVVDIGPGGTSSVRTGVSFANALSYSLNVPIRGVSSAELMGIDSFKKHKKPTAVLFKSIKGNYFCGIYTGAHLDFLYADLDAIRTHIKNQFSEIVLAGSTEGMQLLGGLLGEFDTILSDIHQVSPEILGEYSATLATTAVQYPNLPIPITETNLPS